MRHEVELGHPDFGRLFRCRCMKLEDERAQQEALRRWCALPPALERCTFAALEPWREDEVKGLKAATEFCRRYAAGEAVEPFVLLSGPHGTGKTHLGLAVLNWRLAHGGPYGRYTNTPRWLKELQATFNRAPKPIEGEPATELTYEEVWQSYAQAPLVMMDDLGMEKTTEWTGPTLNEFLDLRYREERPTIITTNLARHSFGSWLDSRLRDQRLVKAILLYGPDYRLRAGRA